MPERQVDNPPRSLRARQALATRGLIVEAAATVFENNGYRGARVEDIATGAGVAYPTVYKAFANKRNLLAAAVQRAMTGGVEEQIEATALVHRAARRTRRDAAASPRRPQRSQPQRARRPAAGGGPRRRTRRRPDRRDLARHQRRAAHPGTKDRNSTGTKGAATRKRRSRRADALDAHATRALRRTGSERRHHRRHLRALARRRPRCRPACRLLKTESCFHAERGHA